MLARKKTVGKQRVRARRCFRSFIAVDFICFQRLAVQKRYLLGKNAAVPRRLRIPVCDVNEP